MDSLLIITGGIGVFESICVLDWISGGGIGMMSLADSTILLGNSVGWCQSGVAISHLQDPCMFLDESIAGFLGQ